MKTWSATVAHAIHDTKKRAAFECANEWFSILLLIRYSRLNNFLAPCERYVTIILIHPLLCTWQLIQYIIYIVHCEGAICIMYYVAMINIKTKTYTNKLHPSLVTYTSFYVSIRRKNVFSACYMCLIFFFNYHCIFCEIYELYQ